MFRTRYFYYYHSNLFKHFHFYNAISDVCKENNIKLELITFVRFKDYLNIRERIRKFKSKSHVLLMLTHNIVGIFYFFFVTLFNKRTVIHFKQTHPGKLTLLKKIFPHKIVFVTDLEGDKISEREYLLDHSQNKLLLNSQNKKAIKDLIFRERIHLNLFDFIFVYNPYFKELIKRRHPGLKCQIKVSHLMSFKKGKLFFNEELRQEYRSKLNWNSSPIVAYVGNVYYPWQNISKTIKIYKRIKNELNENAKLLLLINKKDHPKALEFIDKYHLNKTDFYLTEVNNDEINGYLNASDIGIVLRDLHEMNKVVTSGKFLDYLGCGLPVITTSVLLNFNNSTKINQYGIILDDLNVVRIPINRISNLLNFDSIIRKEISAWSNENLSLDTMSSEYINLLKKLNEVG